MKIDSNGDMSITNDIIIGSNAAIQFSDGTTLVSSNFAGPSSSVLTPADADINADYGGDGIGDINFKINGVTKASILNNGNAEFGGDASVAGALDVTGATTLTGNVTVSGTVDGRDISVDGDKLDGIEEDATNVTNNSQISNGRGYITSTVGSTPDFNTVKYNNAIDNKFFRVGVPYYLNGETDGSAASQLQWWYNDPESYGYNSVMVLLGGNGGQGWSTTSDRRLKQDITDYPNALEKVLSLRPVTYRWKTHPDADPFPGFIAQEVQEIFPEFVNIISKEGGIGMNYGRLVVPIVKAIQDQQEIIDQQGEDIQALINRIEALEAMN
ncbi:MAG: tail fiber domain-containing protein, partial [Fidelibacterota bacterium]